MEDEWMDGWVDDGWMIDGQMDGQKDRWMHACIDEWMDGLSGWTEMDGDMDGWLGRWMDGQSHGK